ncbi:hypothetical protein [Gemmiger formicilis]|uniref:hypothetical protein n=1 Tax=Gemmiger formicilis TaxID=745368 RepID=UPI003995A00D
MKRKIIALLLCFVCVSSLCFPVAADDDGYSAIISDIDKTCPTCGSALHAFWWSTSGAEVEVEISDTGKIKIPAGAGAIAHIDLKCKSCGYEKKETRLLGLDFGAEKPGKLVQAPSGIGRKDLPGYADDNGTALVDSSGRLTLSTYHLATYFDTSISCKHKTKGQSNSSYSGTFVCDLESSEPVNIQVESADSRNFGGTVTFVWTFTAPVNGWYSLASPVKITGYQIDSEGVRSTLNGNFISLWEKFGFSEKTFKCSSLSDKTYFSSGTKVVLQITGNTSYRDFSYNSVSGVYKNITCIAPIMAVEPVSTVVNQQTNITINNNTWNGNIYVDNSTNLTYIYPQYTTINEKNETVTNISNTPIIYNNETKQYYTYDETTKNYYYITYVTNPTPTPSPVPEPSSTPNPSITPSPTPTPGGSGTGGGGDVSTPETGKPGNSSGSSWWDKLLSKIGDAIIDGLLGAVSAVLKLIFKLFSTILSWIIWAVSRVFDLLPFLPPGLGGLLVGGVVVCFVIGIIKFIRG